MTSVGEDFPQQQERVRHLIDQYRALEGGVGAYGAAIMDEVLKRAADAQSSGDLVRILRSYQELVNCE